ncbi:MAG: NAD(P)H-dependent oxidoreductase [Opitutales bacterium]|nr:NAD(P)H-dependent oxidoreductase [Opitutales bacterium]
MIVIISGTNREGSLSSVFSHLLHEIYQKKGIKSKILELSDLPQETFSPNAYTDKPPAVLKFTQDILNASGLVIVVPEYNGSMPGALKLFIDLLPYPDSFEGRPICYIGIASGQFGGLRPVEHLQQVFGYRNAYNFPKRVFVPAVHNVASHENGIIDIDLKSRLSSQAEQFIQFCRSLGKVI